MLSPFGMTHRLQANRHSRRLKTLSMPWHREACRRRPESPFQGSCRDGPGPLSSPDTIEKRAARATGGPFFSSGCSRGPSPGQAGCEKGLAPHPTCAGNWGSFPHAAARNRFSPTCVGNTPARACCCGSPPVQPNVRGEHGHGRGLRRGGGGSAPRAWGTHPSSSDGQPAPRFSPTCVGNTPSRPATTSPGSVQPHVRGEHLFAGAGKKKACGSAPRACGTPGLRGPWSRRTRFSPTCVGNTARPPGACGRSAVQPHVRGEHGPRRMLARCRGGSAPRAWGTHGIGGEIHVRIRFSPTCVGNTRASTFSAISAAVQPHVRGEHTQDIRNGYVVDGSAPRAWGTLTVAVQADSQHRFSPTCVGNTRRQRKRPTTASVQPHVRGEHSSSPRWASCCAGSAPRAWGTRGGSGVRPGSLRFSPTCVGNTAGAAATALPLAVQPHVRGEHSRMRQRQSSRRGSAPRAWGTRRHSVQIHPAMRFSPTCVGNTSTRSRWRRAGSVQPHVRGEHYGWARTGWERAGSAPRAWGTLPIFGPAHGSPRFSPTCVGNTPWRPPMHFRTPVQPHVRGEHGASGPRCPRPPVQPHVRGEHAFCSNSICSPGGSAPRAWGTRRRH